MLAETVHQLADEPDTVLVLHHFATGAQARSFLTSREPVPRPRERWRVDCKSGTA